MSLRRSCSPRWKPVLADLDRLKEINEQLKDPDVADRDALLKEKARIERQQTIEGSLELAKEDLTTQHERIRALPSRTRRPFQDRIDKIDEILTMRGKRGLTGSKTAEVIHATFIGDKGQLVRLLIEAVDKSDSDWPPTHRRYYVLDATTPNSGHSTAEAKVSDEWQKKGNTARSAAILQAIVNILEGTMGYGRGYVAVLIDGRSRSSAHRSGRESNPARGHFQCSDSALDRRGRGRAIHRRRIAYAADPDRRSRRDPFRIPAISRAEAGNLRWDLATAMDIVNIASAALPWGGEIAVARKAMFVGGAMLITGIGANALGVVLMGVELVEQLKALEELPPELRGPRAAEIIGGAMLQAGIMVGTMLASHSKLQEKGAGAEGIRSRPRGRNPSAMRRGCNSRTIRNCLPVSRRCRRAYASC